MMRRRWAVLATVGVAILALAGTAAAQFGRRGRTQYVPLATPDSFDGRYNYCRVAYPTNPYGRGGGWSTDYPDADINFSIRLSELTKTPVAFDGQEPRHLVVRLTDEELYHCPLITMLEVGTLFLDEEGAAALRTYLLKGGFLWVDDFWGSYEWDVWQTEIQKVFSPGQYPIIDVPTDHVMMRTLFEVPEVPQVPSINHWFNTGGGTSERGADSAEVHTRAILDENGRIMVLMTHNTDIGDSWEREALDPRYFYEFSVRGYAVGINIVVYALTH